MWDTFWHFLWSTLVIFAFIAYLMICFNIIVDLFSRDHRTSGWLKAVWVIFVILLPYLTALVCLVVRGGGMAQRARDAAAAAKEDTDNYIRQAAGRSPARKIVDATSLLDCGAISERELQALTARALQVWGRREPLGAALVRL